MIVQYNKDRGEREREILLFSFPSIERKPEEEEEEEKKRGR
jgi:hypothetical protein